MKARYARWKPTAATALWVMVVAISTSKGQDGNRLAYLDEFCDPYYVGIETPKLITPQWIGEPGVEAVVTLGIDDMRDPAKYENYLRPILERLKQIDGRAPVSIMTNSIDPHHPQLQTWLREGLSLETHTIDHPCPCLHGGDFEKAKSTYDRCVDLMAAVPGNAPVAFRFPCMDSQNTPSPRGFAEIINRTTPQGNFLHISTSVSCVLTSSDRGLPPGLTHDEDGTPRFEKYIPFPSYVNKVYNYPYPFVIGRLCWEMPCAVPDDWQGQNLHAPRNPKTVEDYQAVIDATVIKRGVANLIFHPHDWISNLQMISVIDHVVKLHGKRVKFLSFRECLNRINQHLLAGQSLRAADGQDNGVRILDVNNDGYMDVVIGNEHLQLTRIWQRDKQDWLEVDFPVRIVDVGTDGVRKDAGVRFGIVSNTGMAGFLVANRRQREFWQFEGDRWARDDQKLNGLFDDKTSLAVENGRDLGMRLRDIDTDGTCEVLLGSPEQQKVLRYSPVDKSWQTAPEVLPEAIVDAQGRDAGLRFVDLDYDGRDDLVFSNGQRYAVYRYGSKSVGWTPVRAGQRSDGHAIPAIVRGGMNNGAWFANQHMWIQNEHTSQLPDKVDRRSFAQLLGKSESKR